MTSEIAAVPVLTGEASDRFDQLILSELMQKGSCHWMAVLFPCFQITKPEKWRVAFAASCGTIHLCLCYRETLLHNHSI